MKVRKVSPKLWDDPDFLDLEDQYKLAILFLWFRCDGKGEYRCSPARDTALLGFELDQFLFAQIRKWATWDEGTGIAKVKGFTRLNRVEDDTFSELIEKVIAYLNHRTGARYLRSTPQTRNLVCQVARRGHSLNDFMAVIDVKTAEWLNTEMAQYLRPQTLFGNKFEAYLQQSKMFNAGPRLKQTRNDFFQKYGR